jgi:hypothetical protein
MLFWVSETFVGFVPDGRYEGSDSTELAEVLVRSAWKNTKKPARLVGTVQRGSERVFHWLDYAYRHRLRTNARIKPPIGHPQPRRGMQFGLGAVLQYSNPPRGRIRGRGRGRRGRERSTLWDIRFLTLDHSS